MSKPLSPKTVERYFSVYIVLKSHDIDIKDIPNLSEKEYIKRTNRTSAEYRLAKSLSKNVYVQKEVNKFIKEHQLESTFIKPVKEKEYFKEPIEHRADIQPIIKRKKEGTYYVVEVIDNNKDTWWISAKNNTDLQNQIKIIEKSYKVKIISSITHGKKKTKSFLDSEFKKEVEKEGIEI